MSRTFSRRLGCGCWVAEMESDGWEGCIECAADWFTEEDLKDEYNKKLKELHDKCWKDYLEEKE